MFVYFISLDLCSAARNGQPDWEQQQTSGSEGRAPWARSGTQWSQAQTGTRRRRNQGGGFVRGADDFLSVLPRTSRQQGALNTHFEHSSFYKFWDSKNFFLEFRMSLMLTKPYEMFFSVDHGEVLHQCCGSGSVFRSVVDPHM